MNALPENSPALIAAREAEKQVRERLSNNQSFLLEAGAGAGKTYSLIEALKHLIGAGGAQLRRNNQRIACITYTNAATAVISSRIDSNPLVFTDTIHAFCWSLIKRFQVALRKLISEIPAWKEKIEQSEGVNNQPIDYDLGYRRITPELITLHHDDVLSLMVALLPNSKFQELILQQYPFIFIDEYQDTNIDVMRALREHLLNRQRSPVIGLFGDHWQQIYDKTCGHVEHAKLLEIGKKANFRSATKIVDALNAMRPELPQAYKDENFAGSALVFHTNSWVGQRRPGTGGGHWKGDMPADVAHNHLNALLEKLKTDGWNFSEENSKILMLTHNILASEQGYESLGDVFEFSDQYIKKEDRFIEFFSDALEPACSAFEARRFGEMFLALGNSGLTISSHAEKVAWSSAMDILIELRKTGTVGQVLDHIQKHGRPKLPEAVTRNLEETKAWQPEDGEEPPKLVQRIRKLLDVPYREIMALDKFIDGHTPFATKHSVKGDEFENVLVVIGRGWNKYNFDQFLSWSADGVPNDKKETYERNRNLFYVCCSRPTTRLALLFTQELSPRSLETLQKWFGEGAVQDFSTN